MKRRNFLAASLAMTALPFGSYGAQASTLRIGLTPVFLDDQAGFLAQWHGYLEAQLARPVEFVQRGTYREIVDLLRQNKLDIAWLCGYPYVRNRRQLQLLAVPLYAGRPLYQSYLIVPAADTTTRSILDLRGRVFAFSDSDSNSGFLYPNYRLLSLHERPESFFGKAFFTWAHRKVVEAVASRVAHGGAVDGYVWETLAKFNPELTARTRIVERSPDFGFPPFVARVGLPAQTVLGVRRVLTGMSEQAEGRKLLELLNLSGFAAGDEAVFAGIERMSKTLANHANTPAAA